MQSITRRDLLGRLALAIPATVLLSACGGSAAATPSSAAPASSAPAKPAASAPASAAAPASSAAASSASAAKPLTKATYLTAFHLIISFAPSYVAKEAGFWSKRGLDVTIHGGTGTESAIQQLTTGAVFMARANGINTIQAVAEGVPVISVMQVYQNSQFNIVSPKAKAITDPKNFAGKTVGVVSKGGATENLLDLMLVNSGIDPKQVKREVTGASAGAFGLMEQGKVDAFIATQEVVTQLQANGSPIDFFNTAKYAPEPADNYMVATKSVQQNPDEIVAFLGGFMEAITFLRDPKNASQAVKYTAKYDPEETKDAALAAKELEGDARLFGAVDPAKIGQHDSDEWTKGQDLLLKAGLIKKKSPLDQLFTNTFIDQVKKA